MKKEDFKKEYFTKLLGKGKFGFVYEVEHNGIKYAAKTISKRDIDYNKDTEMGEYLKTALKREITVLKKMSEFENSVQIYLDFEDDEDYILILELCDLDLSNLLEKKGKFSSSEILYIMEGLNKPFKYMHNNDLLHRDIKPENIMIKFTDSSKTTYIPKISDYGLARKLEDGKATTYLGTPLYMAPEIFLNDEYNDKSDLFSIGVMMYQLHFGSFPFNFPHNKKEIKKYYSVKKKLDCEDKDLDDLINKLLTFDAEKRISWDEYFDHPFFKRNKGEKDLNNKLEKLKIDDKEHKIINVFDYTIEKIIYQNLIETEELQKKNENDFISIDECLNPKNGSFFILGVLGKYLEKIGISVVIDRNEKPDFKRNNDLKEYHKNIFQFICNNYILKHKYILEFDLNENRKKYLLKNPIERSAFNENLKNILMKIFNLKEEEILLTNIERNNKFTSIIVFKSNFNLNVTKDELINYFEENDERDGELKTLSNFEKELIIPKIKLSQSMLNPKQNNLKGIWGKQEIRGGEEYHPPLEWINYAINIDHCFNDKNFNWLKKKDKGEWCIGYCGIKGITKNTEQIYENDNDIRHLGKKIGLGVYCPSDPKIFEENTETININGDNYKVGFMLRIKPDKIRASEKNKNDWVLNGNDNEFRPYGILLKKI